MIKPGVYTWVLLVVLLAGIAACTQDRGTCFTPKTSTLTINSSHYKNPGDTSFVDTALPNAVFAAMVDTSLKAKIYTRSSNFTVSLSPTTEVARWLFTTDSFKQELDTLTFYYRRKLHFISNACGFTYYFTLDSVHTTHNNIDSTRILNTDVSDNVNTKHLRLYIKPGY